MIRLTDPQLADLARRNGLGAGDLITAVACAIAASDGDPAYHHVVLPGPVADYRGLWGLDVVEYPVWETLDLFHPERAAWAAGVLCKESGGWSWCPAYRSGRASHYLERATPAASMLPGPGRPTSDIAYGYTHPQVVAYRARLAEMAEGFAGRSRDRTRT